MSFDSAWLPLMLWIPSMLTIWCCILCVLQTLQKKRREILLTYLMLCRLREETEVCGRCSLHIQCFQTLSKWILHARYNTLCANNFNTLKLCDFNILRQQSFRAREGGQSTPAKANLSEKCDFYLDIVLRASKLFLLPKNWIRSHSVYFLLEITDA